MYSIPNEKAYAANYNYIHCWVQHSLGKRGYQVNIFLVSPREHTSNGYPQHVCFLLVFFFLRNKKIINILVWKKVPFYRAMIQVIKWRFLFSWNVKKLNDRSNCNKAEWYLKTTDNSHKHQQLLCSTERHFLFCSFRNKHRLWPDYMFSHRCICSSLLQRISKNYFLGSQIQFYLVLYRKHSFCFLVRVTCGYQLVQYDKM